MSKDQSTNYSFNFTLSLFSESMVGVKETRGQYQKTSIYDIADITNVKEYILSEYLEDGQRIDNCGLEVLEHLDLESIVLNKIDSNNNSNPSYRRVRAIGTTFVGSKGSIKSYERKIVNEWNPRNPLVMSQNLIRMDNDCIGFVDQVAVAADSSRNVGPRLELIESTGKFKTEEPTLDFSGEEHPALKGCYSVHVLLPCENCNERKYSLNAVCYKSRIFLFDLKERKFTKSIKFVDNSIGNQFALHLIGRNFKFIPYIEGNRLRSFIRTGDYKLFEFYWNVQYEELACVEHCTWIGGDIYEAIVTDEDFGFIIEGVKNQIILYKPAEIGKSYTDGRVKVIDKQNIEMPPIWCSKSKVLYGRNRWYQERPLNFEKPILTMDEINQTVEKNVSEILNYQELVQEFEFSCYNEAVDHLKSIKKVKGQEAIKELRSEFIYRIENNSQLANELEIIAGYKVENCEFPKSSNYKEIELKDFVKYLGAPIIFQLGKSKNNNFASFFDLEHGKCSSKVVKFGDVKGRDSTCHTDNISSFNFIGILAPKSN